MSIQIPESFIRLLGDRPAHTDVIGSVNGSDWLASLPRLIDELMDRWSLTLDDKAVRHGHAALVLPVRREGGYGAPAEPLALKVTWPHREAREEGRTLGLWSGRRAVRLVAQDPHRWALLLERLDPTDLSTLDPLDQADALGALARALDRPAPPWAPSWTVELDTLMRRIDLALDAAPGDASHTPAMPPRLLREAHRIARMLSEAAQHTGGRLVHSDLHQYNVLRRRGGYSGSSPEGTGRYAEHEWVAIDPKPVAGPLSMALAPMLWNQWGAARATGDLRGHLNARLDTWCDAAGIDPDEARLVTLVRAVQVATELADDGAGATTGSGPYPTRVVTVAKAMLPG